MAKTVSKTISKDKTLTKAEPKKTTEKSEKKLDKTAKPLTKAAPAVALSKILPKEELAASYVLADSEVDDFEEDEKARTKLEEFEDEDADGPPEWWKSDPAAIEGAEDDEEGERGNFDDSDEWTEDDEWADDDKKSDSDNDSDDNRDW